MTRWDAAEAEAQLEELLDQVETVGPQMIVRGSQEFRIMTIEQLAEELQLRDPRISVAEFLLSSSAPRLGL